MTAPSATGSGALARLRAAVDEASGVLRGGGERVREAPALAPPPRRDLGDYSTNAALLLAPVLGAPPREVAERLCGELSARLGDGLARCEVAGPGFVNLHLSDGWHRDALVAVLEAGEGYGGSGAARPDRVLVEFVSANPTGPLTAASGRHAAYGDALARVLAFHGHTVAREYYVNDAGSQVLRLGASIRARARGEEVPEDGYRGDYVADLAAAIPDAASGEPAALAERGVELLLEQIRATLGRFRVAFDAWFSERTLHAGSPNPLERAYERLEERGQTYRSEGALWLRTGEHGDDKDRVLRRSTGEPTYFASDLSYHEDKRARGFEHLIDVFGADHHGYVGRMRAGFAALGGDPDALEIVIMQFVHIAGTSMSKRRGEFVTLDELIELIGVDAARFFLLARSHDTTVDLDLDLAAERSSENPVYYVQYAHARIASLLARAGSERVAAALADSAASGDVALHPTERGLVRKLLDFPDEVAEAAARRAPHRIANYGLELAQEFTAFYRDCPVLGAQPDALARWRLALSVAAERTIARALDLLGVAAPESM
jgi:arginyl-tRNA synthetase